jgi:alpha-beta hydrolase superfamily lysophospholipase
MTHREDRFAAGDGLTLYEQAWLPAGQSRAAVVVVHGVTEHGGRYARLAGELNQCGYAVHAMDLRGHGRSEGDRILIRRFDQYLDDVELFLGRVAGREAGKPLFLFGHSMGGAIVALLAATRQPNARGVILSAPAVLVAGGVFPVLRRLAGFVSAVWPTLRLVHMGCQFLSRDPAVVAEFRSDPLVFHGGFPVCTGAEILRAANRLQTAAGRLALPLLVLHGTGDVVTDHRGSRLLVARAGSTDKSLRLYPGLYHDLINEPEREQVLADLLVWLDGHQ